MWNRLAHYDELKNKRLEADKNRTVSDRDLVLGTATLDGRPFMQNAFLNPTINTNIADPIFVADPDRFFDQFRLTIDQFYSRQQQQPTAAAATDDVILRPLIDHINPYLPDLDSTSYEYTSKVWSGEREPNWRDSEPTAVMSAAWRDNIKDAQKWRAFGESASHRAPTSRIDDLVCTTNIGSVRIPRSLTVVDTATGRRRLNLKLAPTSLKLITKSIRNFGTGEFNADVHLDCRAYVDEMGKAIDAEVDAIEMSVTSSIYIAAHARCEVLKKRTPMPNNKCVICKLANFSAGNTACRHFIVCYNCMKSNVAVCPLCMNRSTANCNMRIYNVLDDERDC